MDRIKVMIVMEEEDKEQALIEMLTNVDYINLVIKGEGNVDLNARLETLNPDVLLIGGDTFGDGYKIVERLTEEFPDLITIIIEEHFEEETIRRAVFAGGKDVLVYPVKAPQLLDSIYKCYQKEQKKTLKRRASQQGGNRKRGTLGNVIALFSNKGGVGKTFLAVNLATSLAMKGKDRVALVDLDLDYGNVALAMNLISHYTLSDVINDIRNLDRDLMESYMIPHSSGLMVLASPAQPQLNEFINSDHISAILKVLRSSYDYIVVDMPSRVSRALEPVLHESDQLFMVVDQNLATIQNVKSFLVGLETLNYPKGKVKVLLNSFDPRGEVKQKDIEVTLNVEAAGVIPADYRLAMSSMNRGIPLNLFNPRSKMTRSIDNIAGTVLAQNGKAEMKKWQDG